MSSYNRIKWNVNSKRDYIKGGTPSWLIQGIVLFCGDGNIIKLDWNIGRINERKVHVELSQIVPKLSLVVFLFVFLFWSKVQSASCLTCVRTKSLPLCLTLWDPMDCSLPGSSIHWILPARILEWVAMPSSRGSSWPRDWTCVSYISCTGRRVLYH